MDLTLSSFDILSAVRLRVGEDKTELAQHVDIPDPGNFSLKGSFLICCYNNNVL